MSDINAYPLSWPVGWVRSKTRKKSAFKVSSFAKARDELLSELRRMGVGDWNVIISSNIPLRNDGLPYSGRNEPNDPGIAVYFKYKNKQMVFACDTYTKVTDNLWAIRLTVQAIRGINRWGASDMIERAFTGFTALPESPKKEWWDILEVNRDCSIETVKTNWRRLAKNFHPDICGDDGERMSELNAAYAEALKWVRENELK